LLSYATENHVPLVLATTGYTFAQEEDIIAASRHLPIFRSANLSFGVLIMRKLLALATPYLEDFDIELIEAHHNQKADAPSGTAKLLVKTINESLPVSRTVVLGHGHGKRNPDVIGVHAVRAGSIAGDHTVLFASEAESIEISHRAFSKEVFAQGALRAAAFIASQSVGLYSMDDLL
jgi:4-hydroxy-tetrahydrodipicolinate reductase